jgi:signal transduction histidine kinase
MGQFSVEKPELPGSVLTGNQHADEIQTIIDPFKRGSAATAHGAGLGLSIVNRIVQSVGGRLDLRADGGADVIGLIAVASLPLSASSRFSRTKHE